MVCIYANLSTIMTLRYSVCITHTMMVDGSHCILIASSSLVANTLTYLGVGSLNFVSDMNGCIASDDMSTAFACVPYSLIYI